MEEFINSLSIYDYIGLTVISVSVILGMTKGFMMIFGKVVSLVVSFLGAKIVSVFFTETVYNMLGGKTALYEKTLKFVESQVQSGKLNLEKVITSAIDNSIIPMSSLKDKLINDTAFRLYIANESIHPINDIAMKITETLEPTIIYILSIAMFILLFIILRILTSQLTKVMNKIITGVKVTGMFDTLLGGLLGLIRGISIIVIVYYILFLYITVIGNFPGIDKELFINSRLFTIVTELSTLF